MSSAWIAGVTVVAAVTGSTDYGATASFGAVIAGVAFTGTTAAVSEAVVAVTVAVFVGIAPCSCAGMPFSIMLHLLALCFDNVLMCLVQDCLRRSKKFIQKCI